jgi:cytoskeleton protein RodZ
MSDHLEQPELPLLSPGAALKQAREAAGLTLDVVSQRTLIPLVRLRALEDDDYEQVGVATFVMGYTRSYSRFLGLNPDPLLRQLEELVPKPSVGPFDHPSVALALQVQRRPRSMFWPGVLGVLFLLALGAYLILEVSRPGSTQSASVVSSLEEGGKEKNKSIAVPVIEGPSVGRKEDISSDHHNERRLASEDNIAEIERSETAVGESVEDDLSIGQQWLDSSSIQQDEITLSLSDECWVQITDATGKAIIARSVSSGDNLRLLGRAPFEVMLGNAAAATVMINGRLVDTKPLPGRNSRKLTVSR